MRFVFKTRVLVCLVMAAVTAFSLLGLNYWQKEQVNVAIQAMSWVVAGRTLIVDPGHGGEDPGKVSPTGLKEKDINLAVAHKLSAILAQGGAQVVLTRDDDRSLGGDQDTVRERKRADLAKRVEIAETAQADIFVSLHCNSFPSSRWFGAQTFYHPAVAGSKELAVFIQDELAIFPGNTDNRKPRTDTSSVIFKRAKIPVVNVEMGFLSNPQEERLLQDPAFQDKLAWSIYAGIVQYLMENGDKHQATLRGVDK